jgi:hypothetical protein
MFSDMLEMKQGPGKFQVLFLRNDASQEVEVHEVRQVDYLTVQERLEKGDSVFITSRTAQKIKPPKHKGKLSMKTKLVTAFYIDQI